MKRSSTKGFSLLSDVSDAVRSALSDTPSVSKESQMSDVR